MSDPVPGPLPVPAEPAPPVPREVRLWNLVVVIVATLAAQVVLVGGWIVVLVVRDVMAGRETGTPTPGPRMLLLLQSIDFTLAIAGAWYFACWRTGRSFRNGLRGFAPSRRVALIALGLGVVCVAAKHLFLAIDPSRPPEMLQSLTRTRAGFLAFATLGALSPIFEEIYYRGFMFLAIENRFGRDWATTFVTVWFVALHIPQYWPSVGAIASILALSLSVTLLRARTGSWIPGMITHALYNWTILAIALVLRDNG